MKNEMLISGLTGVTSQIITWPTEFLKTSKQLPKYKNTNIFCVVKNEIKVNGIKIFYRGSIPQIVSAFPRSIVRFNTYNTSYKFLNKYNSTQFFTKFICGVLAGSTEALLIQTPAEVIKVECINNKQNPINSIKSIFTKYGLKGFWHGSAPTVIRQGTSQGISFPIFNIMKPRFNNYDLTKSYSSLLAGVCGGISAVLINNPIDAIKTYKQSDFKQNSILEISKTIYKTKGIKGFYNGMGLRLLRMAPLHGCTFYFYDLFKEYLS